MPVDALRPGCDFGQHTFGVFHGLEFAFLLHGFGAGVEEALSDEYPGSSFSGGTRLTALMLTKPAFDICGMADVNPSAGLRLEYVDMNHAHLPNHAGGACSSSIHRLHLCRGGGVYVLRVVNPASSVWAWLETAAVITDRGRIAVGVAGFEPTTFPPCGTRYDQVAPHPEVV